MKKPIIFILVAIIAIITSCHKEESTKRSFVKSTVSFRATYVNEKYSEGYDSIYISVDGLSSFSFKTHNNPCLNISYGFTAWSKDTITNIPYIISTERDTLEYGLLTFTVSGYRFNKN